jgi:hypothetical protein
LSYAFQRGGHVFPRVLSLGLTGILAARRLVRNRSFGSGVQRALPVFGRVPTYTVCGIPPSAPACGRTIGGARCWLFRPSRRTIVVLTYQTAPPFLVDDAKQG